MPAFKFCVYDNVKSYCADDDRLYSILIVFSAVQDLRLSFDLDKATADPRP